MNSTTVRIKPETLIELNDIKQEFSTKCGNEITIDDVLKILIQSKKKKTPFIIIVKRGGKQKVGMAETQLQNDLEKVLGKRMFIDFLFD